jgi:hypothetical protein
VDVLQALLRDGRCRDRETAFLVAVERGHTLVVCILLPVVEPRGVLGTRALHSACGRGYADIVHHLLVGGRVDCEGALRIAAGAGHVTVVARLLCDVPGGYEALAAAVDGGHSEVVGLLLADSSLDACAFDHTLLHGVTDLATQDVLVAACPHGSANRCWDRCAALAEAWR